MRPLLNLAAAAISLLLAACAATPPAAPPPADPPQDPAPAPIVVLPAEPTAYELRQKERALALARQGRLADAALTWELLATIRPKVPEYRDRLAELQRQITTAVAERQQRGEQAAARGQIEAATQQFLAALALQPDNQRAADALRSVERERIKRTHLGKLSRNTMTRRAMSDAEMTATDTNATAPAAPLAAGSSEERNEVEHASLLASQGEWDEAIAMLERRLRTNRRDDAARELLADVYFQKAEALAVRNRSAAVALLERSVRADPKHPRAPEKLRQMRAAAPVPAPAPAAAAATAAVPAPASAPGSLIKPAAATITSPAANPSPTTPRR